VDPLLDHEFARRSSSLPVPSGVDGELVTEDEDLSSELALGLATNQQEVEQEADQCVEDGEGHDGGASHRHGNAAATACPDDAPS
jgi:hypothetical protein